MITVETQRVLPLGIKLRQVAETLTVEDSSRIIGNDNGYVRVGVLSSGEGYIQQGEMIGETIGQGKSVQTELTRRIGKTIITIRNS